MRRPTRPVAIVTLDRLRQAAGVAIAVLALVAARVATASELGFGSIATLIGLVVAAIGCAADVAASLAGEHLLVHERRLEHVQRSRASERRGRDITAYQVRRVVEDGVGTVAELAEVLGVYEYVARKMVDTMVEAGTLRRVDGFVTVAPTGGRSVAARRSAGSER